jgi:hypothetical protein
MSPRILFLSDLLPGTYYSKLELTIPNLNLLLQLSNSPEAEQFKRK